jgi:uncharacterized protein YcnI
MFARTHAGALLVVGTLSSIAAPAWAHVSLASGPGYANQTQVLTFSVGHGCEGADTVRVEVQIPKEVTTVRGIGSAVWGEAQVQTNDTGVVTSIVWSKDKVRPVDDQFYELRIRIRVPDAAFTTLYFPAKQTCRTPDGKESEVNWAQRPGDVQAGAEGEEMSPAPQLTILPVRSPGWNKFTVKNDVSDLTAFADAQIVWSGDAAYSSNPMTLEQIKSTDGVSELTALKSGDDIWVKY